MVNGKIKMQLNDAKCEFIPCGKPARAVLRGCLEEGIRAHMRPHGIDLGVDMVAGTKRRAPHYKKRALEVKKRVCSTTRIDTNYASAK